jgi:hypothetical protein
MKQFDKDTVENWRPYAVIMLAAGAITAGGTIFGFGEAIHKWFVTSSFSGSVNGLGGYSDLENVRFVDFVKSNVGETAIFDVEVVIAGPVDVTPRETTCVSPNSSMDLSDDPGLTNPEKWAWMNHEEILELYEAPQLKQRLLGFQENPQAGDAFIVTYSTEPCVSLVVTAPEDAIRFVQSGAHDMTAVLEGEFRIALQDFAFDGLAARTLLTRP